MKKLLGLILNCFALCLCSAIGIGAGMYWMQNQQNHPPATPAIQQTGGIEQTPHQQAPNLLRVPTTTQPSPATPIPTTVIPHQKVVQPVALDGEAVVANSNTEPEIVSVTAQVENGVEIPETNGQIALDSPPEKILVVVKRIEEKKDIYTLQIKKPGKTVFEKVTLMDESENVTDADKYTISIETAGDYTLNAINKNNPSEIYSTKQFTISPSGAIKPFISQLTDTLGTSHIVYDRSLLPIKQMPAYLMRKNKFTLTVPPVSGNRTVRVKYRKIENPGQVTEKKGVFNEMPTSEAPAYDSISLSLGYGTYEIQAEEEWIGPLNPSQELNSHELNQVDRVRVIIPESTGKFVLEPTIVSYKNQKYPQSENATPITNELEFEIFDEYLQLSGSNGYPDHQPQFLLFNDAPPGNLTVVTPAPAADVTVENLDVSPSGSWQAILHFKKVNANTKRVLYVRTVNGVHHAYSSRSMTLKSVASGLAPVVKPELTNFEIIKADQPAEALAKDAVIYANSPRLAIQCKTGDAAKNLRFLVFTETQSKPIGEGIYENNKTAKFNIDLESGQHRIFLRFAQGDQISLERSEAFTLNLQTNGLEVKNVQPPNFGTAAGVQQLTVTFSPGNPLNINLMGTGSDNPKEWFQLIPSKGTGVFLFEERKKPTDLKYNAQENAVILTFKDLPADIYQLVITGSLVKDKFGNELEGSKGQPGTNYVFALSKPEQVQKKEAGSEPASMVSDFVEYHEYERRKEIENGFNPSDKVVTRVARLYYYRDAHRVAQILNSEVQSLNQKGYDEAQILADKARSAYQTSVKKRRLQEDKAVLASQKLRQKENDYRTQQQILSSLVRERASLKEDADPDEKQSLENGITAAQQQMTKLRAEMSTLSATMNEEDQKLKELNLEEENLSEELFRREVRAENTDLYTIANGKPGSYDAVRQVTIKVIGEGLIHLRGPIKGVNIIRTMINQIDAPVGQVRIAMHTIQVNGEDGKRMETVADRIQKSIDQSRFLTVQSAQMLRKAIVSVASEVAISTCQDGIGLTQEQRDEKYLYAFFGQDFIEALREMDSEFLQSGNKLLSIHSMDTTSLSSALFVLALAKNDIRQQILARFYASLQTELPEAELQFLYQGGPTKANKPKHLQLLAPYANFQSFKGFFDYQVIGTDTMTPVQREFVRLAQIFKAKLITERELNLHVMERAMIEQRVGNYLEELQAAKDKEKEADDALEKVQDSIQNSQIEVVKATTRLESRVIQISTEYAEITGNFNSFEQILDGIVNNILREVGNDQSIDIADLKPQDRRDLLEMLFPLERTEYQDFYKRILAVMAEYYQKSLTEKYAFNDASIQSIKQFGNTLQSQTSSSKQHKDFNWAKDTNIKNADALVNQVKANLQASKGAFTYGGKVFHFEIKNGDLVLNPPTKFTELDSITKNYVDKSKEVIKKLKWYQQTDEMLKKLNQAEQYQSDISKDQKDSLTDIHRVARSYELIREVSKHTADVARLMATKVQQVNELLGKAGTSSKDIQATYTKWMEVSSIVFSLLKPDNDQYQEAVELTQTVNKSFNDLLEAGLKLKFAEQNAQNSRQQLDHKKFLDMQIDQTEDKFIDLVEGTRAHTANIDNYLKRIATALEDDFNTQFYYPAFKEARDASRYWNVSFGSMETTSILTNNRSLGKVAPKATIEFDLPKRELAIIEGMNIADAAFQEYGALVNDPTFLAITSMNGGENVPGGYQIQPDALDKQILGKPGSRGQKFGSAFENLIPDPAVFKFETGTGYTVRPVIQPDGQAVVFDLNYLYRTNVREPVRADEKHLGRIKEHFIDTDVQLGNYELREISRFTIALKASRTANGVPLLSDVPGVGVLFRPTPSSESSLQQSQIMSQAVIYPTLFDLMGLRWAPAVADLGPLELTNREFVSKGRDRFLKNRVYDYAGSKVDQFLEIQDSERRSDLYRTQQTIPDVHPNGYIGPGLNLKRSTIQENYHPEQQNLPDRFIPESNMQERIDTDRAIPVLPTVPRFPSVPPAAEGPTSSTRPIRDSGLKPASWSPTSEASKSGNQSQDHKGGSWISSPRRITKLQNQQTQTQTVNPAPVRQAAPAPRNIQPAKPESPGFYKRSVSRFKSLFNDN